MRIISLFLILLTTGIANAAGLPVSVAVENNGVASENAATILKSKLESALTDAGIHSEDYAGLFMIAKLSLESEQTVEGGMRKLKMSRYELSLSLEQPVLAHRFATTSITLTGSGTDGNKALMDAIRKLNPSSSVLSSFITSSNRQAEDYYTSNQDAIIAKAMTLGINKEYDAAIALLWALPYNPSTYERVTSAVKELYTKMQREECSSMLAKARTAYSLKHFEEAAEWIASIDPSSECGAEASKLASRIGTEFRNDEKERQRRIDEAAMRESMMEDRERQRQHELKKKGIEASADVAKAYYRSRLRTVYYVL